MIKGEREILVPKPHRYKDTPLTLDRTTLPGGKPYEAVSFQQDGIRYVYTSGTLTKLIVVGGHFVEFPCLFPDFKTFVDKLEQTLDEQKPKGLILPGSTNSESQLNEASFSQEEVGKLEVILNRLRRHHKRLLSEAEEFFDKYKR